MNKHTVKKQKRTEEIIRVLIPVFAKNGLDKPTISELAAVINRGEVVLFRHFGNKEGIILACAKDAQDTMQKGLIRTIQKSGQDVSNFAENILSYVKRNIKTFRFVIQVAAHPVYSRSIKDSNKLEEEKIEAWTEVFVNDLKIAKDTAENAAKIIDSVITDYIVHRSESRYYEQMETLLKLFNIK